MQEALQICQKNGYIRSFLDEGTPMERLLLEYMSIMKREARHEEQQVSLDYVQMLLSLFPKRHARNAPDQASFMLEALTAKELSILSRLRQGASNKEIAHELGNTVGTVKVYLHRIYGKLGVTNRTQAMLKAQEFLLPEQELSQE
nr:helix-turn-helix transcriptional regulator [Brevibacillus sp. AY1]